MYAVLTECALFRGLSAHKIEIILRDRQFTVDKYSKDEVIALRDTAYSGLMIVLRGEVRGESIDSDGRRTKVDDIASPQLIAPAFLFGGYNRLPMDIVANCAAEILTLHRGLIFELMQEDNIILSNFIDIISNRANMLSKKIYFLSFKTIKSKLSRYILEHTSVSNTQLDVSDMNYLAECLDSPRNSIITVIEDMRKDGIVECVNNKILVLKRELL